MAGPAAPVEVSCPAKLNLFLEVLGKRPDGYHDIETVMVPLPMEDRLTAERAPAGEVSLALCFPGGREDPWVPAGEENLALRAARLVLGEAGSREGVLLRLTKMIPAGAGLGGGSSDAAGALRAVNRMLGNPVGEERLAALALSLGSDVPYFLRGGAVRARGRGERLESVPWSDSGLGFVVFIPPIHVSTADVYARCGPPAAADRRDARPVLDALAAGDPEALSRACFNRLEGAAREVSPKLARRLDQFRRATLGPVHLTGSGSSCFVVTAGGAASNAINQRSHAPVRRFWF